jgi:predicted nucleotidyltransferase
MSIDTLDPATLLDPPDEATVARALTEFAATVHRHYGDRLVELYLFGSRARGDHRPDSDADVAVVLHDGDWIAWKERWTLNRLAYEPSLEGGLAIQPWPFSSRQWKVADTQPATKLTEAARREAIPLSTRQ